MSGLAPDWIRDGVMLKSRGASGAHSSDVGKRELDHAARAPLRDRLLAAATLAIDDCLQLFYPAPQ